MLAAGADDRRAARDDRAGAAVVADREMAPVRRQRLGAGPEDPPGVGRVVQRRVEVDVVGDRERQVQRDAASGTRARPRSPRRPPTPPARPHQRVERAAGSTAGPTALARSSTSSSRRAPTRGGSPGGEKIPSGRVTGSPAPADPRRGSENEHEPIETKRHAGVLHGRAAPPGRARRASPRSSASPAPASARAAAISRLRSRARARCAPGGAARPSPSRPRRRRAPRRGRPPPPRPTGPSRRRSAASPSRPPRHRGSNVAPAVIERDFAERLHVGEVLPRDPHHLDRFGANGVSRQSPPSSTTLRLARSRAPSSPRARLQPRGRRRSARASSSARRPRPRVLRDAPSCPARAEQRRVVDQAR